MLKPSLSLVQGLEEQSRLQISEPGWSLGQNGLTSENSLPGGAVRTEVWTCLLPCGFGPHSEAGGRREVMKYRRGGRAGSHGWLRKGGNWGEGRTWAWGLGGSCFSGAAKGVVPISSLAILSYFPGWNTSFSSCVLRCGLMIPREEANRFKVTQMGAETEQLGSPGWWSNHDASQGKAHPTLHA